MKMKKTQIPEWGSWRANKKVEETTETSATPEGAKYSELEKRIALLEKKQASLEKLLVESRVHIINLRKNAKNR
jgi:hypothetical protein